MRTILLLFTLSQLVAQSDFVPHELFISSSYPMIAHASDWDGDSDVDIFTGLWGSEMLGYLNDGTQNFTQFSIEDNLYSNRILCMDSGDIDGDGDQDYVCGSYDYRVTWLENLSPETGFQVHSLANTPAMVWDVHLADFNNDGLLDILVVSSYQDSYWEWSGELAWYEQEQGGDFICHIIPDTPVGGSSIGVGDLNGDGWTDIVFGSWDWQAQTGTIIWFENNASQILVPHVLAGLEGTQKLEVLDFDQDGDVDIRFNGTSNHAPGWYENEGAEELLWRSLPSDANYSIDYDGDGDIDLLQDDGSSIHWYRNDGEMNFSFSDHLFHYDNNQPIVDVFTYYPADIDLDGDFDLVLGIRNQSWEYATIWYENQGSQNSLFPDALPSEFTLESVYPNPFNTALVLKILTSSAGDARIHLYDIRGKLMGSTQSKLSPGVNSIPYYPEGLDSGVYLLNIQFNNSSQTRKVSLLK